MTWDEIAAQAGVALLVVRDGAVHGSNPAARQLVEPYGAELEDVLDRVTLVRPGTRTTTVRWPSPTGGTRWWDITCYPMALAGSLYVIVDETDRYGEEAQSLGPLTAQWRLHRLETMTGSGTWLWSVRDGGVLWSESLLDLFGIPRGTPLDYAQYRALLHPDDVGMIEETLAAALRTLEPFTYTHRMVLGDLRTERVFECFGEVFADAAGVPSRVLGTARDVTDAHRARQELAFLADHDPLTGVANRRRITGWLAECAARPGGAALLLVDIDNFKDINDLRGHAVGDRVIRDVAHTIKARLGSDVLLGRLGGDEFAVIVPSTTAGVAMGWPRPSATSSATSRSAAMPGCGSRSAWASRSSTARRRTSRPCSPTPTSRSTRRNGWAATGRACSPPSSTRRPRGGCRCCSGWRRRSTRAR
jgi:GGDEF domain-containing protein/PAS domain-containing protein